MNTLTKEIAMSKYKDYKDYKDYKVGDILLNHNYNETEPLTTVVIDELNYNNVDLIIEYGSGAYGICTIEIDQLNKHFTIIGNLDSPAGTPIRPVGDITADLEPLLFELHMDHDMQHGEVLALINGWQKIHAPQQIEVYEDGTHPTLQVIETMYGPITVGGAV
jgi:hypothetical protein